MKEVKPKAFIKKGINRDTLPDGNPFGVLQTKVYAKNTREFARQSRMMQDVQRTKRTSPLTTMIDI